MKRFLAPLLLLSGLLIAASGHAQSAASYTPRRAQTFTGSSAQPLAAASTAAPASVVADYLARRGIFVPASSLMAVGDPTPAANGVRVVRLGQRAGGLDIYGVSGKAAFSPRNELVFVTHNFVTAAPPTVGAASVTEAQALATALGRLYPNEQVSVGAARREQNAVVFARTPFFHDSPRVTQVAVPAEDGTLFRGLLVETWSERANRLHETLVGPSGVVLADVSRTSTDSYNVFVEDPDKTPQAVVSGPTPSSSAPSPDGWLFAGAQTSVHITGNNANAYLDVNSNNRVDAGGTAISNGDFLATADLTAEPSTAGNRDVAVQNLFYLNNVIHDALYTNGFIEGAGNFQESNFGKGGKASDSVLAEAQDGGGLDNANFATPSDGRNPRMQMYLWSGPGPNYLVDVAGGATYAASGAAFGPALTTVGLTGTVVAAVDTGTDTADGCEAITNNVSGQIALINRGTCTFVIKVANAQAAGAIGVIVANNVAGGVFTMGGTDRKIRIPSVMVSQADGASLRALSAPSVTLRANPNPPPQRDGTVDADIVFHEYGHGLTWRMIGSMSGPLSGAIGEGASDALAMLMNGDDRIAEYSAVNPNGIRRFPYAGYPNTYADVDGSEVHDDGEIYGAIVWRMIELFGAEGATARLYNYVVDGMNYTPAGPAYEDMRDGILQSVAAGANPADCGKVWQAFAQFGVGEGASGTVSRNGVVSITESFMQPVACN
ncbi:MAG TPA: M36 family metallopeptidase [Vicinamibacterales bacterium]|nr:M36 family metallopeptidase [Vicinamibacterales bacterium]